MMIILVVGQGHRTQIWTKTIQVWLSGYRDEDKNSKLGMVDGKPQSCPMPPHVVDREFTQYMGVRFLLVTPGNSTLDAMEIL